MISSFGRLLGGYFWLNVILNVIAIGVFFIFGAKIANWQLGILLAGSFAMLVITSMRIKETQLFHVFPSQRGWTIISVILIIAISGIWFFGEQLLSTTSDFRLVKFNRHSIETDQKSIGERIYIIKEGSPYYTEKLKKIGIAGNNEEGYYVNKKLKHRGEELIGLMLRNGSRFVNGVVVFVPVRDIKLVKVYNEQKQLVRNLSSELDRQKQITREARAKTQKEKARAKKIVVRKRQIKTYNFTTSDDLSSSFPGLMKFDVGNILEYHQEFRINLYAEVIGKSKRGSYGWTVSAGNKEIRCQPNSKTIKIDKKVKITNGPLWISIISPLGTKIRLKYLKILI